MKLKLNLERTFPSPDQTKEKHPIFNPPGISVERFGSTRKSTLDHALVK